MPKKPAAPFKDPSLHRLPPQSIEAEESILSAILIDNSTLLEVLEILSPEDFYRSSHQKIFAAVGELFSKSEPIDLVTLTNLLRDRNQLEEIGAAQTTARELRQLRGARAPSGKPARGRPRRCRARRRTHATDSVSAPSRRCRRPGRGAGFCRTVDIRYF